MQVDGRGVLVAGAGSGLGEATARRMHELGAVVVLADLASSTGEQVARDLGGRARFVPADITNELDVRAALDAFDILGAEPRVLVNCAGVATPGRILGRNGPHDLERFRRVVDVNLVGSFNVLRLTAERMVALEAVDGERGVVVLTASIAAFEGQVGQAAYASSKAAVHGLTLCAARDLAEHRIRVCTVAPGTFQTPMLAGLDEQARTSLATQVPNPSRLGRPDEYAALVEHIVGNQMLNGETIRIDGALRMAPR
jgi:NAD(P)-dependent dehydrogenase (short-subunit alcohol dehydrogenase family)